MSTYEAYTHERAATIEHEWDRRALDWPGLTTDAIVVEVGGYTGRWALQMALRYWPRLYVYEPQGWAAEVCREVLRPYGAMVFDYGLGVRDEVLPMTRYETDGCTFIGGDDGPRCELRDAARVLPDNIEVMLMNIEGYEYTLLPYLMERRIHPRTLMAQFHKHAEPEGGMARVELALAGAGYRQLWTYGLTLMAWGR